MAEQALAQVETDFPEGEIDTHGKNAMEVRLSDIFEDHSLQGTMRCHEGEPSARFYVSDKVGNVTHVAMYVTPLEIEKALESLRASDLEKAKAGALRFIKGSDTEVHPDDRHPNRMVFREMLEAVDSMSCGLDDPGVSL